MLTQEDITDVTEKDDNEAGRPGCKIDWMGFGVGGGTVAEVRWKVSTIADNMVAFEVSLRGGRIIWNCI